MDEYHLFNKVFNYLNYHTKHDLLDSFPKYRPFTQCFYCEDNGGGINIMGSNISVKKINNLSEVMKQFTFMEKNADIYDHIHNNTVLIGTNISINTEHYIYMGYINVIGNNIEILVDDWTIVRNINILGNNLKIKFLGKFKIYENINLNKSNDDNIIFS